MESRAEKCPGENRKRNAKDKPERELLIKNQAKAKQTRKDDNSQLVLSNRFALLSSSSPEED